MHWAHCLVIAVCYNARLLEIALKKFIGFGFGMQAHRLISESVPHKIQFNSGVLLWAEKAEAGLGPAVCIIMLGCAANL